MTGSQRGASALRRDYGQLLRPYEAARVAGISTRALGQRALAGSIPCFQVEPRGHRRYPESACLAIAEEAAADGWIPAREVAGMLNVTVGTVREWAKAGRLGARKRRGAWQFAAAEVAAYLADGRAVPSGTGGCAA